MGLKVLEANLSKNLVIFGMMVFGDCSMVYFDRESGDYQSTLIERGTIIVDPNVYFERNLGCVNNTIIHECVHWYYHKKYHELVRLYDPSALLVSCRVHESSRDADKRTDVEWMEWHANAIAPRILMPKATTAMKIRELEQQYLGIHPSASTREILEYTILELADFFGVSKQAAKIRLLDLGYREAESLYNYLDDHYISSYSCSLNSKNKSQTYDISIRDAALEYINNKEFRYFIETGGFLYVDGHVVINDSKYVAASSLGGLCLTEYARNHIDECSVRFDLEVKRNQASSPDEYLEVIQYRKATSEYGRCPKFPVDDHNLELYERAKEFIAKSSEFEDFMAKTASMNFNQTVSAHIDRLGINQEDFYERTLLDDRQWRKVREGKDSKVHFDTAIAICVGLDLGLEYGEPLIRKAGYFLDAKQYHPYRMLLTFYRGQTLFECNEVLTEVEVKPIRERAYRDFLG
jgi:hypothetical protein